MTKNAVEVELLAPLQVLQGDQYRPCGRGLQRCSGRAAASVTHALFRVKDRTGFLST